VSLREELALKSTLLLTGLQNILQKEDQKSLGIDFRYLNITVWVSVKQELILNGFGKEIEEYLRGVREVRLDMFSNAI
jgi:hypothetical protein